MFIGLNNAITGLTQDQLSKTIKSLFSKNEQGTWYDPSDLSTLYQDAAGTTPVTAMEQPVGLVLDKSKGLVLGTQKWSDASTAFDGESSKVSPGVYRIYSSAGVFSDVHITDVLTVGKFYEITFTVDSIAPAGAGIIIDAINATAVTTTGAKRFVVLAPNTRIGIKRASACDIQISNISVRELLGNHAYQSTSTTRPVLSARVNQYLNTATLSTQNVTTLATTYTLRFEGAGSITLSGTATGTYTAGAYSVVCTTGTLTSTVTGTVTNADLRPTNAGVNLPPYQWVNTATDYDTSQAFRPYLKFDGVDDFLQTNSIDFTSTDKMTVVAGVRKLSDAVGAAVVFEISPSAPANTGSFGVFAPDGVNKVTAYFRGTLPASARTLSATYAAPITSIITCTGDISGDSAILRINGTQAGQSTTDQGAGNYGNYPLYIGSRGGTSLPFNGQLYGLVIRGALSSTGEILGSESYMNLHTGAY